MIYLCLKINKKGHNHIICELHKFDINFEFNTFHFCSIKCKDLFENFFKIKFIKGNIISSQLTLQSIHKLTMTVP